MKCFLVFTLLILLSAIKAAEIPQPSSLRVPGNTSDPLWHTVENQQGKFDYLRVEYPSLGDCVSNICAQTGEKPVVIFDIDALTPSLADIMDIFNFLGEKNIAYFASALTDTPNNARQKIIRKGLTYDLKTLGKLKEEIYHNKSEHGANIHISRSGKLILAKTQPSQTNLYDAWVLAPFITHPILEFTMVFLVLKNDKRFDFITKQVELASKSSRFLNTVLIFALIKDEGVEINLPNNQKANIEKTELHHESDDELIFHMDL